MSLVDERFDVVRRSLQRELGMAQESHPEFVDIFQHSLDELDRLKCQVDKEELEFLPDFE